MTNKYHLQRAASDFRLKNGIGSGEPMRMKNWLAKLGVFAMFRPLSDHFSGMAVRSENHRFVLINSNHRLSKQNFTVAHELFHLFIQDDFVSELSIAGKFDKKNKVEYEADWFAAYLLMPEESLLSLIPESELGKNKIRPSTLVQIEQYLGCSRKALLIRLDVMDLIDFKQYEAFTKGIIHSAELLGYDTTLYRPGNENLVVGDYGIRAKRLFDKGVISESHFISLMRDIGKDIENLVNDNEHEE